MPYSVYSTVFIRVNSGSGWTIYYVPQGYVAVVKYIALVNLTAGALVGECESAGVYLTKVTIQGSNQFVQTGLHAVAGPGDTIGARISGPGLNVHMSGFLLKEAAGAAVLKPQLAQQHVDVHPLIPELGA